MTNENGPERAQPEDVPPKKEPILLNWLIVLVGLAVIVAGGIWLTGGLKR